jgi:hypothetical protein
VSATFERVQLVNNGRGLSAEENAQVTLSNSVVASNGSYGITVQAFGPSTPKLTEEQSVLRANGVAAVDAFGNGSGARSQFVVRTTPLAHAVGVNAESNPGATVSLVLSGNALADMSLASDSSEAGARPCTPGRTIRRRETPPRSAADH